MSPFGNFGPSIGMTMVDGAVLDTLKTWLPTYLTAQERAWGYDVNWLKRPGDASYVTALEEIETLPDAVLPAIVVMTPGTVDTPTRDGNGNYSAEYRVVTYAFVRGSNMSGCRKQADMFVAAIVRALAQKGTDNDIIAEITPDGMAIDPVDDDSSSGRNLAVGVALFTAAVDGIVNDFGGPVEPDPPPDPGDEFEDYPEVTSVDIEVTGIPVNQD